MEHSDSVPVSTSDEVSCDLGGVAVQGEGVEPVIQPVGPSSENRENRNSNGNGVVSSSQVVPEPIILVAPLDEVVGGGSTNNANENEVVRSLKENLRRANEEICNLKIQLEAKKRLADMQQEKLSEATELMGQLQEEACVAEDNLHKMKSLVRQERSEKIERFRKYTQVGGVMGSDNVTGMLGSQESRPEISPLPEVATMALVPYVNPDSKPEPEVGKPASGASECLNQSDIQVQDANRAKFPCDICEARYTYLGALKKHKLRVHSISYKKVKTVGCSVCGKIFPNSSELLKHKKQCQPTSVLPSSHLNPPTKVLSPSSTKWTPNVQVVKHSMDITKRCQGYYCRCGLEFMSRETLDSHLRPDNSNTISKTNEDSLSKEKHCSGRQDMRREKGPRKHANVKHVMDSLNHHQSFAGYSARKKNIAKIPVFVKNPLFPQKEVSFGDVAENWKKEEQRKVKQQFSCFLCQRKFKDSQELGTHMTTVHTVKRKRTIRSGSTEVVDNASTSVKSSCPAPVKKKLRQGGKSSQQIRKTERHVMILYENPLRFTCKCGKEYNTKDRLESHVLFYKKKPILACDMCTRKFRMIYNLNTHMRDDHNVDIKFISGCHDCGMAFRKIEAYKHHCLTVHNRGRFGIRRPVKQGAIKKDKALVRLPKSPSNSARIGDRPTTGHVSPAQVVPSPTVENASNKEKKPPQNSLLLSSAVERNQGIPSFMLHQVDKSVGPTEYRCTCGKQFDTEQSRQFHFQYQKITWRYACLLCKTPFYSMDLLNAHKREMHSDLITID